MPSHHLNQCWKFEWNFRYLIFQIISVTDGWVISCELALKWMSLDLTDDKSTLVQVMAWCRQAASHYLSQCWPRSLSPYGVTRLQWVNSLYWIFFIWGCSMFLLIFRCTGMNWQYTIGTLRVFSICRLTLYGSSGFFSLNIYFITELSLNSSNAGDRIFWLCESIPCLLLMYWLLKSSEHQQAWYWLWRTDNMYFCSSVNFINLGQAKSKMRFKMWIYLL